jgi:hypothetical protein
MATDFPNSPANGATHTFGGNTYTYDSTMGAWTGPAGSSGGGASVTVSETAPSSPAEGDLWFDPSVLKTFVYYNDGSANQWVQSNPTGSGGGGSAGASVTASDTAPSSPSAGDLWYKSDTNALYVYYNDGDSSQWVGVSGPAGATGATGAAGAAATGYGQVPIVYTEPPTTHVLNKDGSTSTVQMQAVDPEGTAITYAIAYANATNARPNQLVADTTINQSTGTFTFDPSTNSAHAGSFKARLSASDGITHATRFVDVSLAFFIDLHFLCIGGGGGGGDGNHGYAGGGGAGGYRTSWNNESSGGGGSAESAIQADTGHVYTITVGAGGAGAASDNSTAASGSDSSIARTGMTTITSVGGGRGGTWSGSVVGGNGGSGGGTGNTGTAAGTGTANQGYNGGSSATDWIGSGGGGAGEAGDTDGVGHGGDGLASTITGSSVVRAGGGSGSSDAGSGNPSSIAGGDGGGGEGKKGSARGGSATANTGSGGGAGGTGGGDGGSGVVILRMNQAATSTTGSPTVTQSGGDYIYTFNANGTLTI